MINSCKTDAEKKKRYFDLKFLLQGKSEWYLGMTLATDEQDAISNFLIDYSPSMGTVVAVHVFGETRDFVKSFEKILGRGRYEA